MVDAASNKTNCDVIPNNSSCTQTSCVQPPCTMLCGLTSPYKVCRQLCHSSRCNALECRASKSCLQLCRFVTCESMTCDAKDCTQSCFWGRNCSRMTCSKTVKSCSQVSGSEMICEGDVCGQSCRDGRCHMTCPIGGTNCTQVSSKDGASMECNRGLCMQFCHDGRCNMNCSSSVTAGLCHQTCGRDRCESMVCSATNCTQSLSSPGGNTTMQCEGDVCHQLSHGGDSSLICPQGVKSCTQVAYERNVTLRCHGDVCQQVCFEGDCNLACLPGVTSCTQVAYEKNAVLHCDGETCQQTCSSDSENCQMTCSASVKECHQICPSGKCLYKCDAEKCTSPFPKTTAASTAKSRGTALQMGFSCVGGFMLALIFYKQLFFYV